MICKFGLGLGELLYLPEPLSFQIIFQTNLDYSFVD